MLKYFYILVNMLNWNVQNVLIFKNPNNGIFFNFAGFQKTHDYLKSRVFSTSKFYEHAIGALDIYRCITIVGPPGCGKTLTALQLAFRKCGRGLKSQLYFCQTLEEVLTTAREDNDAYIIVDEFLDKYFYYPSTLCEAIESLDVIFNELIIGKKYTSL